MARGCSRCGYKKHHVALDLHHKRPHIKEFKIGCTTVSILRLKAEMDKCVVLCSNCHKIFHYENGWLNKKIGHLI